MRRFSRTPSFVLAAIVWLFAGCEKDPLETPPKPDVQYTVTVKISNMFGDKALKFGQNFITAAKDTIRFKSQFAYYLSNFRFTRSDGSVTTMNESYYLIHYDLDSEDPSSAIITINNVPAGTYGKISFMMGVDSARNHSGAQTGALDPGFGMIWMWNTGYIFTRLKGAIGADNTGMAIDIGGDQNIMKYDLTTSIELDKNKTINLKMDMNELFQGPNVYDLKVDDRDIHSITTAGLVKLVANSKDMFTITSVE